MTSEVNACTPLPASAARGVRRGSRRFGGALEPMHRLLVTLEHPEREIAPLAEARVEAMRLRLTAHLEAALAAGYWLRFARALARPHGDDRGLFRVTDGALGLLDDDPDRHGDLAPLVPFAMLASVGYALELERCVACGRPCPEVRPSAVDARRGGLLCRACGYASTVLSAELRRVLSEAQAGRFMPLQADQRDVAARLAQEVATQHVGHSVR